MDKLEKIDPKALTATNTQVVATVTPTVSATPWSKLTRREKWQYIKRNITVEPMLACYIMPSVLAGLATQNLNLEKACRVNLNYETHVCDALTRRETANYTM